MSSFFPTGHEMCPDNTASSTTCPSNVVVWGYYCCGESNKQCCGTITGFGWLLVGIISMILTFSILCAVRCAIKRKYSDRHGVGVFTTASSYENQATDQYESRTIM